jgi:hypothetical protein
MRGRKRRLPQRSAAGPAEVLCADAGSGILYGYISYAENGICVRAVKEKYVNDPDLVRQEGVEPGDATLFERRCHKAKYYAYASWSYYGFRKVSA